MLCTTRQYAGYSYALNGSQQALSTVETTDTLARRSEKNALPRLTIEFDLPPKQHPDAFIKNNHGAGGGGRTRKGARPGGF